MPACNTASMRRAFPCGSRRRAIRAHAALAASWWRNVLSLGDRSAPQALTLSGATIDPNKSALTLLAGAAAATAAGDTNAAASLSGRAAALARYTPTYYGNAWAALGAALLERSLDPCASD